MNRKQFAALVEEFAPLRYAYEWDNSGYNVALHDTVEKVFVCLDATEETVKEAIRQGCDTILSHHPLLFHGVKTVTDQDSVGKALCLLIQNGINLYCAHTSFDCAPEGMNLLLARALGLQNPTILSQERPSDRFCKVVTFVPKGEEDGVRSAMCSAGAGCIGAYSDCSFSTAGEGTFLPGAGTNPYIGKQGVLERVEEVRLECICQKLQTGAVISAVKAAHSYEEPVIDVYDLAYPSVPVGIGTVGDLPEPMDAKDLALLVKKAVGAAGVHFNGTGTIRRVACLGGAGGGYAKEAAAAGAQALVTGEAKYNHFEDARALGVGLYVAGHFETEHMFVESMCRGLQIRADALQYKLECLPYNGPVPYAVV